jgi:hypothetical protein
LRRKPLRFVEALHLQCQNGLLKRAMTGLAWSGGEGWPFDIDYDTNWIGELIRKQRALRMRALELLAQSRGACNSGVSMADLTFESAMSSGRRWFSGSKIALETAPNSWLPFALAGL